jgi:hypothetical protein
MKEHDFDSRYSLFVIFIMGFDTHFSLGPHICKSTYPSNAKNKKLLADCCHVDHFYLRLFLLLAVLKLIFRYIGILKTGVPADFARFALLRKSRETTELSHSRQLRSSYAAPHEGVNELLKSLLDR